MAHITTFKAGDCITRTQESADGSNDFQHTEMFLIDKVIRQDFISLSSPYGTVYLPTENWAEGWEFYN